MMSRRPGSGMSDSPFPVHDGSDRTVLRPVPGGPRAAAARAVIGIPEYPAACPRRCADPG